MVAEKILEFVGGKENIQNFTHCATRLRFNIDDEKIVKQTELSNLKEVLGVVNKGGQLQIIIGPSVEKLYHEMTQLVGVANKNIDVSIESKKETKKSNFDKVLAYISGAIQPTLAVIIGAGMINAILSVSVLLGLSKESGTYVAWSTLANVGFTFLPVFVAFSAARKMNTNEYIAAFLSLAMVFGFNQKSDLSMFGVALPNIKFANSIIPVLLMVPVLYYVDRLIMKIIPSATHFTIKPLITIIIMAPLMLFIFGPSGAFVGTLLANMCIWLMDKIGSIAMAILALLHPITVMFGMQYLFTPLMVNEVAQTGSSFLLGRALAANFAMAGAALAVGVKAKKIENKSVGFSSCVTALLSVTEPALYGCLIRLRKPLISACAAAGISGIFIGLFKVQAFAIASPNLLSMPIFIGGTSMLNFFLACGGAAIGFGMGFIITYLVGFKED